MRNLISVKSVTKCFQLKEILKTMKRGTIRINLTNAFTQIVKKNTTDIQNLELTSKRDIKNLQFLKKV